MTKTGKGQKDTTKEVKEEKPDKKKVALDKGDSNKVGDALGAAADKEAKETNLNKKNDFSVDYTKTENVAKKLKEL